MTSDRTDVPARALPRPRRVAAMVAAVAVAVAAVVAVVSGLGPFSAPDTGRPAALDAAPVSPTGHTEGAAPVVTAGAASDLAVAALPPLVAKAEPPPRAPRVSRSEDREPPSSGEPAPAPSQPAPGVGSLVTQVLALVNVERVAAGCGALSNDSRLASAALAHSRDMAANDYFSHDSQDGRSFADRISAAGYSGGAIAENIAAGQSTATAVVAGWMESAGHRANILNCAYTDMGLGYATGGSFGTYWTQDFGG